VGDFSEEEVESCLLDYLGTLTVDTNDHILKSAGVAEKPVLIDTFSTPEQRHQRVFLRDTDERACAYIAGAAPNRWGFTSDGRDLNTLIEPVPPSLSGRLSLMLQPEGIGYREIVPCFLCLQFLSVTSL
jgi:hypothetical protein